MSVCVTQKNNFDFIDVFAAGGGRICIADSVGSFVDS